MIRYRSMRRALKREHFIDIRTGTYRSKKDQKMLREIHEALIKKENNNGDGTGED